MRGKRELPFTNSLPQMPTMVRAKPSKGGKQGTLSKITTWVAAAQVLQPSLAAFQGTLARSQNQEQSPDSNPAFPEGDAGVLGVVFCSEHLPLGRNFPCSKLLKIRISFLLSWPCSSLCHVIRGAGAFGFSIWLKAGRVN